MEVVLLNSGGLDSALLAHKLHADGHTVHSLHLLLGSLHQESARVAAQETAERYCASHFVMDVGYGQSSNYLWNKATGDFIMWDVATDAQKADQRFIVGQYPAQTPLVLSLAVGYATTLMVATVYTGQGGEMTAGTIAAFDALCREVDWPVWKPVVEVPLATMGYAAALAYSGADILDFGYTVSCYKDVPCGTCGKCNQREDLGL